MIKLRGLWLVMLGFVVSPTVHADTAPTVMTYGAGVESCGKWLAVRKTDNWHGYGEWLEGWVSAAGQYVRLRPSDPYAMTAWIDNYCTAHPLDQLNLAAFRLVQELSRPSE